MIVNGIYLFREFCVFCLRKEEKDKWLKKIKLKMVKEIRDIDYDFLVFDFKEYF